MPLGGAMTMRSCSALATTPARLAAAAAVAAVAERLRAVAPTFHRR